MFVLSDAGRTFLVDGICPHRGGPLHLGRLDAGGAAVQCPWHGQPVPLRRLLREAYPLVTRDDSAAAVLPEAGGAVELQRRVVNVRANPSATGRGQRDERGPCGERRCDEVDETPRNTTKETDGTMTTEHAEPTSKGESKGSYAPGIEEFIDRCNRAMPPDFYLRPVEEQRRMYLGLTVEFPYPVPAGVAVTDDAVAHDGRKLPIRVYRPERLAGRGAILYIRGGGFVVGSLDTHHTVVAELAAKSGLTAVALDFRMAPEHPFPAAVEDCYGALSGVIAEAARLGIDPAKVVIAGDSSGANQAVVVSMMARDRRGPRLAGQALISPVLDFTRWRTGGADAPLLTGGEMEYYTRCYVEDPARIGQAYVSPLVSGEFHGLPPAYIMGAEMDSLLVDSREYAKRLLSSGTEVELVVEPGLVHSAVRARGLCPRVADAWGRFSARAARLAS